MLNQMRNILKSMTEETGPEVLLKYFVITALVVYLEISLLSHIVTAFHPGFPEHERETLLLPNAHFIVFVFLYFFFIYRESRTSFALHHDGRFLLLHGFSLAGLLLYMVYFANHFPFPPLDRSNILQIAAMYFNRGTTGLFIRFGFIFLLLSSLCYASLFHAFASSRKAYLHYPVSLAASFLIGSLYYWFSDLLWVKYVGLGVARAVFLLLKLSGFDAVIHYTPGTEPIIGTGLFTVSIVYTCSGLTGIFTFLITLGGIAVLKWEDMDKVRLAVVAYIGVFIMYVSNILRIYILMLIGHYGGASLAVDLWHSEGSTVFYTLVIIMIIKASYEWMKAPAEKRRTTTSDLETPGR